MGLLRTTVAALAVAGALAGCQGGDGRPDDVPTSIGAFPEVPHFAGRLPVLLQPALPIVSGGACATPPPSGELCSPDGEVVYRALGEGRRATVTEVRTAPSEDHTAWDTVVRFAGDDRSTVRSARDDAAGLGGVVLVVVDGAVATVFLPPQIEAGRGRIFGLEKPEAWALVSTFAEV